MQAQVKLSGSVESQAECVKVKAPAKNVDRKMVIIL